MVIVLGVFMTGLLNISFFQRTLQFNPRFRSGTPLAATAFGVSFAIGWTLFINTFGRHRGRLGKWSVYTRPVAGSILILMGIAIVSGTMTRLSSIMVELFPSLATLG